MVKRKVEALADQEAPLATNTRKTRSSRAPEPAATTSTRPTRSNTVLGHSSTKPPVTRVYGGKRTIRAASTPENDENDEGVRKEEGKPITGPGRGRRTREAEVVEASTSSKEKKPRGRPKKNQKQEDCALHTIAVVSADEVGELERQQPLKRRKITPEEVVDPVRPQRTRSQPVLENVDTSLAPQPRRRGRPPKAQATNDDEVREPPANGRGQPRGAKRGHSISPNPSEGIRARRQTTRKQPVSIPSLIPPNPRATEERSSTGQSEKQPTRTSRRREVAVAVEVPPRTYSKRKRVVAIADSNGNDKDLEAEVEGQDRSQVDGRNNGAVAPRPKQQEEPKAKGSYPGINSEPGSPPKRRTAGTATLPLPKTPSGRKARAHTAEQGEEEGVLEIEPSPAKDCVQPTTPSTRHRTAQSSPTRGVGHAYALPDHLLPCFNAQKRAALRALSNPPTILRFASGQGKGKGKATEAEEDYDNNAAYEQLNGLLDGTVSRNEGNSCLVLGPRGSGKSRLVERCLSELCQSTSNAPKPIVIRLSGWVQSNDRLALRQIAVQLAEQTGNSYLSHLGNEEDEQDRTGGVQNDDDNPFLDGNSGEASAGITLPPSSHLPALISLLPTLNRPTIVLVDAFDLFALHPRQALLYCLLDTVQACQSSQGNKGLAVVGITSRVDVVQLLEKRVKSRFSGRIVRVANVHREAGWTNLARECLLAPIDAEEHDDDDVEEWNELWTAGVEKFLTEPGTKQTVHETYSIIRDVRVLLRLLITLVARLSPSQPFPSSAVLQRAADTQRTRTPFAALHGLPYPALCLLIASRHSEVKGHEVFNFEMLYEAFRIQVRASMAAPIQLNGTSIGMVKCDRGVMLSAFESLVSSRIFVPAAAPSFTTPKEFVKYRCVVEMEDLKKAIEKTGQVNLKKWWPK
ncbi:hypothetical protein MD484_g7070, partial [Candolleomyces efflorescens]